MLTKFRFIICKKTFSRICHIDCMVTFSLFFDFIYDDKVILIPMGYTRKWFFCNERM